MNFIAVKPCAEEKGRQWLRILWILYTDIFSAQFHHIYCRAPVRKHHDYLHPGIAANIAMFTAVLSG
jgi:hypothetical protein